MTITIFVSYSHKDDSFRERLDKHLAPLKREKDIEFWFDGDILEGDAVDPEIRRAFKRSSIFVALGSHNYLHSEYCYKREYLPALGRARRKKMRVVVALVSTCDWKNSRMARYKLLPKDGKPVDQWSNRNKAYLDIVDGLRRVVTTVRQEQKAAVDVETARAANVKTKRSPRANKSNVRTHGKTDSREQQGDKTNLKVRPRSITASVRRPKSISRRAR